MVVLHFMNEIGKQKGARDGRARSEPMCRVSLLLQCFLPQKSRWKAAVCNMFWLTGNTTRSTKKKNFINPIKCCYKYWSWEYIVSTKWKHAFLFWRQNKNRENIIYSKPKSSTHTHTHNAIWHPSLPTCFAHIGVLCNSRWTVAYSQKQVYRAI